MNERDEDRQITMSHFERKIYVPVIRGSVEEASPGVRRIIVRVVEPGEDREYRIACYLPDDEIVNATDLRALLSAMVEDLAQRWERR